MMVKIECLSGLPTLNSPLRFSLGYNLGSVTLPGHFCQDSSDLPFVVIFRLLRCIWLLETQRTAACQASSITSSWSLPKLTPLSQWCPPTISSSVVPFFSCLLSFPASRSFQMSQLFASGGQRIGAAASASVLPMNTQDWLPLGWTGCISLQSKGLSRVFSNTTVQKHPRCDPRKGRAEGRQGKDDLGFMKSKTTQGWQAWQPTPAFSPGESRRAWRATARRVAKS